MSPMLGIIVAFRDYIIPFCVAVCRLGLNGFNFVTRDQAYERWEICDRCEHYDPERIACKICGCGMSPDVGGWRRLFEAVYYPDKQCADAPPRWGKLPYSKD